MAGTNANTQGREEEESDVLFIQFQWRKQIDVHKHHFFHRTVSGQDNFILNTLLHWNKHLNSFTRTQQTIKAFLVDIFLWLFQNYCMNLFI